MKTIGMIINNLILDKNINIDVLYDFLIENKILNDFLNIEIYFPEDIENIKKEYEKECSKDKISISDLKYQLSNLIIEDGALAFPTCANCGKTHSKISYTQNPYELEFTTNKKDVQYQYICDECIDYYNGDI